MSDSINNLRSVVAYLIHEHVKIDFEEFQFQVESHPDFPSLLSFSDALFFFNVNNIVTRVPIGQLELLPNSYIALLNNSLVFIQNTPAGLIKNGIPISSEELKDQWKEIVLIIEKSEDIITNKSKKIPFEILFLSTLTLGAILSLLIVFNTSWLIYSFLVMSVIGLILAIETFKQAVGIKSTISSIFCNSLPNSDCNTVINSFKWNLLKKISLSDVSIIFFSGQLIALLITALLGMSNSLLVFMKYGLWLTVPIAFLSIYYQGQIEKKWCPLCLAIIAVLFAELITINFFYFCYDCYISSIDLLIFAAILLAIVTTWLSLRRLFLKNKDLAENKLKDLRFRRNYDLFKLSLKAQKQLIEFDIADAIVLGNPEAHLKIYLVTSPFCSHCDEIHKVFDRILMKHNERVVIYLRFNSNPNFPVEEIDLIFRNLVRIYQEEGQTNFSHALSSWYVHKGGDKEVWKKQFAKTVDIIETDKILNKQYNWAVKNNLNFTPAIIVGKYHYPSIYSRKDLEYFITDLSEDNLV